MHALLICLVAATVGIEVGWQRMPEGGMEYIIQLDPQTLDTLRAGQVVQSDIPPTAGEIRSYRIVVGKQPLPREAPPEPPKHDDIKTPSLTAPPQTLPIVSGSKQIPERAALYVDADNQTPAKPSTESPSDQPAKPWLPLWFTVLGLFTSIGVNVFLGWIAWDSRRQLWIGKRDVGGTMGHNKIDVGGPTGQT
jgi:hypothetical protein